MRGNKSILNHDAYFMHIYCFIATRINPNSIEGVGGLFTPCDAKFRIKKYPCSHNNITALIKQISLFDTALVIVIVIPKVSIQNKKKILLTNKEVMVYFAPPPAQYYEGVF